MDTDFYTPTLTDTFHMFSWCPPDVLFLCQMLSHFVSSDLYQHGRLSHFVFDFLKLNRAFPSVHVNRHYICYQHM